MPEHAQTRSTIARAHTTVQPWAQEWRGGESTPTIGGHTRDSFSSFLSKARIAAARPVRVLVILCSVYQSIRGQDHSLLPASGNASPLQTPTVGARSFRKGSLEAEMRAEMRLHRHV